MGGVDVGGGGGGRSGRRTRDINMIPFIDLLMVTIAFLLITAVWVTNSRINADAQVPGPPDPEQNELEPQTPEKVLHVEILENEFDLVWKQGAHGGHDDQRPPKTPVEIDSARAAKVVRFPDLAEKIETEWKQQRQPLDVDRQEARPGACSTPTTTRPSARSSASSTRSTRRSGT